MSTVYKAQDPNLQRVVAIKLIHPHLSNDPKFTSRFEEEARAVARLRHPNIVQVYDFNHDGDLYYMVQEFVPGETLQSTLRRLNKSGERMPLPDAVKYTLDICNAIGYSHQFGMIHRDIKPANIMLDERGQAILMDFGIVKLLGGEGHTTTGSVVGTVLYMSPDLIRGEVPDARSDIYSLGVTFFEMLSGRPPFEANSAMTLMMMHQNDPVPNLHSLRPEVPGELVAIVEKSLAKRREDRFNSAAEMGATLKRVFDRMTRGQSIQSTRLDHPSAEAPQGQYRPAQPAGLPTMRVPPGGAEYQTANPLPAPSRTGNARPGGLTGERPYALSGTGGAGGGASGGASGVGSMTGAQAPYGSKKGKKTQLAPILAGGGLAAILLLTVCLLVSGLAVRRMMEGGEGGLFAAFAGESATPSVTATTAATLPEPSLTPTAVPSDIPTPSSSSTPDPNATPTVPVGIPYVRINQITLDDQGLYVVEYETFEFTEANPGKHIHFFYNTVPIEQAGAPGEGPWVMHAGPRPFTGLKASDRPEDATQLCASAVEPDHTLLPGGGMCFPLPDVTQVIAKTDTDCRVGPGEEYPVLTSLEAGASSRAEGISPDEQWWYIRKPGHPGEFCFVAIETTILKGDIASLKLVQPPPVPTGAPPVGDALFVEITAIKVDDLDNYVIAYDTHNFSEQLPGDHIHFFFDTTPPEEAGLGGGSLLMHGGPAPFTGYKVSDRPQNAGKMCALVANPDHSIITVSGNCFPLPGLPPGFVSTETSCHTQPNQFSNSAGNLSAGADVQLLGVSPDQSWVLVSGAEQPDQSCWIPKTLAVTNGDLTQLPVIGSQPTATVKNESSPRDYDY
jgi:serine/threonine-protein kinase